MLGTAWGVSRNGWRQGETQMGQPGNHLPGYPSAPIENCLLGFVCVLYEARIGIKQHPWRAVLEVEHVEKRPGLCVKGVVADASEAPVVLDEAQNRRLVGHGIVNEVGLGIWRDRQQGQPGTVATTALDDAALGDTARARAGQEVLRSG